MENRIDLKKVIHAGKLTSQKTTYLFLLDEGGLFQWRDLEGREQNAAGGTVAVAIREAFKNLETEQFQLLNCGYRYTLPERDEVGSTALFKHMIASYSLSTGVYFDTELKHMAKVDFASQEALKLWKSLL